MTATVMSVKKTASCTANVQAQWVPDITNPEGVTVQTGTTVYVMTLLTGNITTVTKSLSDSFTFPEVQDLQTETSMTPADGLSGTTQLWELTVTNIDAVVP